MVEKVINDKLQQATPGRVNRIIALIRAVLRKAEREWGWVDKAPAIHRLKEDSKRIRWITRQEAERLCRELPAHLEALAAKEHGKFVSFYNKRASKFPSY
jgi:hypothetical protein